MVNLMFTGNGWVERFNLKSLVMNNSTEKRYFGHKKAVLVVK